jgi:hypothetical protein
MLGIPHCLDNRLMDGGRVVGPTHRPHFAPQKHFFVSGIHYCQGLSKPQSLVRLEELGKFKHQWPRLDSNPQTSGFYHNSLTSMLQRAHSSSSSKVAIIVAVVIRTAITIHEYLLQHTEMAHLVVPRPESSFTCFVSDLSAPSLTALLFHVERNWVSSVQMDMSALYASFIP